MIEVFVPRESVNDTSVIVRVLNFQDGDLVSEGDPILEIETSKTNIEVQSPSSGYIKHNLKIGDELSVGGILFLIADSDKIEETISSDASISTPYSPPNAELNFSSQLFSQAAELLIKDLNFNKSELGPGWFTTEDLRNSVSWKGKSSPPALDDHDPVGVLSTPFEVSTIPIRKRAEIASLIKGNASGLTSTIGVRIELRGLDFPLHHFYSWMAFLI